MIAFTTPAIVLRRVPYGDRDLIVTLLTLDRGKVSAIAKSAKNSVKRFSGVLEVFTAMTAVCRIGRGKLPILQEAAIDHPFPAIRSDVRKMAYASYWAELINAWVEEGRPQARLYELLRWALTEMDRPGPCRDALSILFQMKLMDLSGFRPNLESCGYCGTRTAAMAAADIDFDVAGGGLVCGDCRGRSDRRVRVTKGTLKLLLWTLNDDLNTAARVRFTPRSTAEGLQLLETFVPYHLGKGFRSLGFLRQLRSARPAPLPAAAPPRAAGIDP